MAIDWAGAGASVLGSIASGLFGQSAADEAFQNNKIMQARQHYYNVYDYQRRYRWSTQDMRAAGLNPILAATQGIGGNVAGTGMAQSPMAVTPDFGGHLTAAYQASNQKEIAKMQNEVAKDELEVRKKEAATAIEKMENDIKISNARYELDKMVEEASVRRADELNSATIQNMRDKLEAEIQHWKAQDMNGAAMASAAMASANAAGLQAAVAAELGIKKSEVLDAEAAYIGIQSENMEESVKWQRWLNDHPQTRGAVGFLGAFFDTLGLGYKATHMVKDVKDLVD